MSKLFKLKNWLVLDQAAAYLSNILDEPVTEADLLRLGIDGRLTLSIHLIGGMVFAYPGTLLPIEDVGLTHVPNWNAKDADDTIEIFDASAISPTEAVRFDEEKVISLGRGIWDFSMFGRELSYFEDRYQRLVGNGDVKANLPAYIDGIALRSPNQVALLVRPMDDRPEATSTRCPATDFYPTSEMPDGASIVVRTAVLTEFIASLSVDVPVMVKEKRLRGDREQNLLRVVAGLWALSELPKEHYVAADRVSALLDSWGWDKPTSGTIAELVLREAMKLPGAKI